ncbi:MAG: WG repeat-containing protein [Spirosomataceae bacterium]
MKSPFKFLDPFTLADRDVFFGRDKEIKELYQLVFKTPLLLIYGLSGTGKTSLIQCGLAGQFDGPDWLPLWVRRQTDLNESLDAALNRALPEAEGTIPDKIEQLYKQYLRPVFLIFDQFEELFILGSPQERETFQTTLTAIRTQELPCMILLVMREEYLGRLYPLEKTIPNLFDFRIRIEPMDTTNVKTVLRDSFLKFNISIGEPPREERLDEIIQNVSLGRSGIELPYLQVYLDLLYRETLGALPPGMADAKGWPALEFTKEAIERFGTIETVLAKFLKEQVDKIQALLKQESNAAENTVKQVLDGFVTEEGTKRPIVYKGGKEERVIEPSQLLRHFPNIPQAQLNSCLVELEKAKILRSDDHGIELAHDSLAKIIDKHRTEEQRQRNDIKRQIRASRATFAKTQEYLTEKQIANFEDILPQLGLGQDDLDFFVASKLQREEESQKELTKERERADRAKKLASLAFGGCVLALMAMFWALTKRSEAHTALAKVKTEQAKNERIIDAFYFYGDSLALAVKQINYGEDKYGFINKEGEVMIDYKYDDATPFNPFDGYARVKRDSIKYLVDTKGNEFLMAKIIENVRDATVALDLRDQELDSIPSKVFRFTQLKILLAAQNQTRFLSPEIGQLRNLESLALSNSPLLETIPREIGMLPRLQMLDLSFNNRLSRLPDELCELKNLESLDLSSDLLLKKLPNGMKKLKRLQELYLRGIPLVVYPIELWQMQNLITLDLSANPRLKKLPEDIGKLKNLQQLYLSETSLSGLPKALWGLRELQILDLNTNPQLKEIPEDISALRHLKLLDLTGCPLSEDHKQDIQSWLPNCEIRF